MQQRKLGTFRRRREQLYDAPTASRNGTSVVGSALVRVRPLAHGQNFHRPDDEGCRPEGGGRNIGTRNPYEKRVLVQPDGARSRTALPPQAEADPARRRVLGCRAPSHQARPAEKDGRPADGLAHHLPSQTDDAARSRVPRVLFQKAQRPAPAPHVIHMRSSTTRARSVSRARHLRRTPRTTLPPPAPRPARARPSPAPRPPEARRRRVPGGR